MKKNFLKATSLFLSLMMLLCACGGDETQTTGIGKVEIENEETDVITSADDHIHSFGSWKTVKAATCIETGTQERTCACGEKETKTINTTTHNYSAWNLVSLATCTSNGSKERTCSICGKKNISIIKSPGHNYVKGICTICNKGQINITLPETPITVRYYGNDSLITTCDVLSIRWEIHGVPNDDTWVTVYWSGELKYSDEGDQVARPCRIGYRLYDSEGYIVESGTSFSTDVKKGEKFRNAYFELWHLDSKKSYTLELLDIV